MTYGRVRRGPMAADAFTQIRNAVFRDSRLSAKAMGIFGNISTHRDGWGITPESIASQMRDGVDAVKSGLRELERLGYLQRERERRPNGTLGASSYFITDQPDLVESARSEPEVDFPPVDEPPVARPAQEDPAVDNPAVADPPHKKITSKTPPEEHHPPSPPPVPAAPAVPAPRQEETGGAGGRNAALSDIEQRAYDVLVRIAVAEPRLTLGERELVRLAPVAAVWLERGAGAEQLRRALTAGLPDQVGSPAGLVRRRLLDKLPPERPSSAAAGELPPWCGCGDHPAAQFNPRWRLRDGKPCPTCHPSMRSAA
ncbi:hypothetical protein [Streptomyces liangshanensis]|uniref:hypothetical protein n=1 Tax=Streptomyces liangshanensis TaxID=2717324 RepID=UPI0036D8F977